MLIDDLRAQVESFNEKNDPYAIGLNFVVAGIGKIQELIQHLDNRTFDPKKHRQLLEDASQMLAFGRKNLALEATHPLAKFVDRYQTLIRDLEARMGGTA